MSIMRRHVSIPAAIRRLGHLHAADACLLELDERRPMAARDCDIDRVIRSSHTGDYPMANPVAFLMARG